ncbi:MAG: hypothetical protein AAF621_00145 [Pseudomonadota bacterium]
MVQQDFSSITALSDKVTVDEMGHVVLRLGGEEVIGLSVDSLCHLLKINPDEAFIVMREAIKIAIESEIQSADQMSGILVHVMDMLDEAKVDGNPVTEIPIYQIHSILSIKDIAEILEVTIEFAGRIFHAYKRPIQSEEDLQGFIDFMSSYIETHHNGQIPGSAKIIHSSAEGEMSQDYIDVILAQKPPEELMPEEERLALQYYREARAAICELLKVTENDADIILSDSHVLKEFFNLTDVSEADYILDRALSGDLEPLLLKLNNRMANLFEDISDNTIKDVLNPDLGDTAFQRSSASEHMEAAEIAKKQAEADVTTPDNLNDTLRLCFELRGRVTSKSLSDICDMWGVEISAALGRFVIEEGKYGGHGESSKRIIDIHQLERLIKDIENAGDLRNFIRKYLKLVNDQVQTMYYGGNTNPG